MERLSSYAVDPVSTQLALLNLLLFVHLVCKGVEYATRAFMRRDPPKKSIRTGLARSDES
ncbi:hypothetical protein WM08_30040 [Burkholderia ubonensis]|uniref:hypothetical protein n=1 Tax=Burkholderia cepacia complex TaxID=87882 RepID=UPI00075FC107|nr:MULTISPECIES: hypothetical protein [Burkholderia cepacia complex]KWI80246.1 hypothetical protein WM08_30040 [Burkholderia ubonensis]MDN7616977.1 hypothetical protein [Burkholderia cepacia]HDR9873027.1 hypothetical protein [Burkholderia cenocepacia]